MKEIRQIKNVSAWVDGYVGGIEKFGDHFETKVECGTCQACCYHPGVYVNPDEERPDTLANMQLHNDGNGWLIPKREDGGCIHLTDKGCGIYDQRPAVCRSYDCRVFSVCSLPLRPQGLPPAPLWELNPKNEREIFFAFLAFGYCQQFAQSGASTDIAVGLAITVAVHALPILLQSYAQHDENGRRSILARHRRLFRSLQQQVRQTYLTNADVVEFAVNVDGMFDFLSDYEWSEIKIIGSNAIGRINAQAAMMDFATGLPRQQAA